VEWGKPNKYLPTPPSSPELNPTMPMTLNLPNHQDSSSNDAQKSRNESDNTFNNVTRTSHTGRLSVTIVEGRKLNVSNFQARPYCVVEVERNEFVTREAIRESDLPTSRGGKQMEFLDLVRAATSPVWKQKAVL